MIRMPGYGPDRIRAEIDGTSCPMKTPSLLRFLIILTLVANTPPPAVQAEESRPNFVFFLVDDLGWSDVQCYGSAFYETPAIDQLAAEGLQFTDAYAACHVCSPTRASILTGKYPARLGLTDWISGRRDFSFQRLLNVRGLQQLPFEETTIAETLQAAGYRTAAIGKWHLGKEPSGPTAHGFDVDIPQNHSGGAPKTFHAPFRMQGLDDRPGDYLTDRITDEALRFIDESRDRPFFLYLAHFAVHDPIQGREDLVMKYLNKRTEGSRTSAVRRGLEFALEGNPDAATPLTPLDLKVRLKLPEWAGHRRLPERTIKIKQYQDNVQFAGMVEAVDQSLGRIVAKLKESGKYDNTVFVFFSDNGGMSGANFGNPNRVIVEEHLDRAYSTSNLPLRGAKGWLYEGGIRVPLIIRVPGSDQAGKTNATPVISTDFYPTLLELADLPALPDQHVDGVSLVPLLEGTPTLGRPAIFWHFPHYSNHGQQSPGGAVRAGDYKLLEYFENGTVQLFNLKEDLGEQDDLSRLERGKVDELRALLHDWRNDISARMMKPNPNYLPESRP